MYSTILNMRNHLDLTQIHPVKLKGGFTAFVYSADRGLAAWFERATCWRGAPWLRHRTWSLQNLSIFHCWFSAIIAIFLFSMSKQTWGLDWCLAFSRISFAFTQTQDTQGLLLAACVYQIHRQKYDKGDTCIQQYWTCEIIWTWHKFILLNSKEVLPSSSTQQTED